MFHEGVTCSDCHEPHSLRLRAEGNGVCLQCHAARKYNSPGHYFHKTESAGPRCVDCHMPTRTYMVVDERRDHSIRIPRPDLSVKLATPNACNNCHKDKSSRWASDSVYKWYGHAPKGFQRFAEAIDSGSVGAPGAQQSLVRVVADREQSAIARATALSMLAAYASPTTDTPFRTAVVDDLGAGETRRRPSPFELRPQCKRIHTGTTSQRSGARRSYRSGSGARRVAR